MSDESLRALERRAVAAPDDETAALAYDAGLRRAGRPDRPALRLSLLSALEAVVAVRLRDRLSPDDIDRMAVAPDAGAEWHRLANPLADVLERYLGPIDDVACIAIGSMLVGPLEVIDPDAVPERALVLLELARTRAALFRAVLDERARLLLLGGPPESDPHFRIRVVRDDSAPFGARVLVGEPRPPAAREPRSP